MRISNKKNTLSTHFINVLNPYLETQLMAFVYHDTTTKDHLWTNKNRIDIISLQLELRFEGRTPLFISWANTSGWRTYSLAVSNNSFCGQCETFLLDDDKWKSVIGHRLERFKIYGNARENNEPHLLVLEFSSGDKFGIANFYYEEDFIPKVSIGDDIWIIFGTNNLNKSISALNLEYLANLPATDS